MEMINNSHPHKLPSICISKLVNMFMCFIDFPSAASPKSSYPGYMMFLCSGISVNLETECCVHSWCKFSFDLPTLRITYLANIKSYNIVGSMLYLWKVSTIVVSVILYFDLFERLLTLFFCEHRMSWLLYYYILLLLSRTILLIHCSHGNELCM